ncbi:MAG: MOSC domain-containing protein [Planctomycetaceae bacterium]|nr:MOSC domain-containing protein [Planctomycetales bacterium]MCB9923594.1 MOSC domain-containing protein [Planctomycetaceae bacterium]
MIDGQLLAIQIAEAAAAPMHSRHEAEAVVGKGLLGDRYAACKGKYPPDADGNVLPKREVTLIEIETLTAVRNETGLEFSHAQTRRNLLTQDVALNHLVDKSFSIGEVELRGVELCEPCGYLESMHPGIMKPLVHRGGLRAQVTRGGTIRVGDTIRRLSE